MTADRTTSLSPAAAWASLSGPVLALAEETAMRRAARARPALSLLVRAGGVDAQEQKGASSVTLFSVAGRPQLIVPQVVQQLASRPVREVALVFSADQSVMQHIVLPQQPDEVLKAIIRNKVESLAPWPLAQCLWGLRRGAAAEDTAHIGIDVAVVSRSLVDDLAAGLRAAGIEVTAAAVLLPDGDEVEIDLGADDVRSAARLRATRLAKLTAAALVLLLGLGLYWIYQTEQDTTRLEAETAAAVATLRPGGAAAGEAPLVAAANRLHQQRLDRRSAAAILDEVSKLLPDSVYLTYFGLNGDELVLKGQGSGIPSLIALLEASPSFEAVNFAAATEVDVNSRADTFSLSAKLEKPQ